MRKLSIPSGVDNECLRSFIVFVQHFPFEWQIRGGKSKMQWKAREAFREKWDKWTCVCVCLHNVNRQSSKFCLENSFRAGQGCKSFSQFSSKAGNFNYSHLHIPFSPSALTQFRSIFDFPFMSRFPKAIKVFLVQWKRWAINLTSETSTRWLLWSETSGKSKGFF